MWLFRWRQATHARIGHRGFWLIFTLTDSCSGGDLETRDEARTVEHPEVDAAELPWSQRHQAAYRRPSGDPARP